jgi:hypothetical protein
MAKATKEEVVRVALTPEAADLLYRILDATTDKDTQSDEDHNLLVDIRSALESTY